MNVCVGKRGREVRMYVVDKCPSDMGSNVMFPPKSPQSYSFYLTCTAPDTISAADAVPWLTRTARGVRRERTGLAVEK